MAAVLGADISVKRQYTLDLIFGIQKEGYYVVEILIKKRPHDNFSNNHEDDRRFTDLRIALVGGLGAGKSTLLSYITYGIKDNGRGSARLNLLRHRHELESGRSSSISHEIIGYNADGQLINYATQTQARTWEEICELSNKVITFLDTCGFPKYLRTTISGLTGYAPDYACLVVAANAGRLTEMTHEHLSIAVMLDLPVFVVMTMGDTATHSQIRDTLCDLLNWLKTSWIHKVPVVVQTEEDAITCASYFSRHGGPPELPIFLVSNVTGSNMNLLLKFFNYLPKPERLNYDELLEEPVEFQIEDVYTLPDAGIVIGGVLCQGRINIRDNGEYYLGPNSKGKFIKVKVISIHRHRVSARYVHCGQTATLALGHIQDIVANDVNWKIHRGMVLLGIDDKPPLSYFEFEAELMVLYHSTGVISGTCGMIHSGSIRQRAQVLSITSASSKIQAEDTDDKTLNTTVNLNQFPSEKKANMPSLTNNYANAIYSGNQGRCIFRFLYEPCYLRPGSRILFIEGKSKILGRVIRLIGTNHEDS
ncbi:P-loop containing nucleoside triphosphate hydrolase protein [Cokeromyces recurvatus]|uniref:P-loop containing nucleoside triphosphate hydrolase protein n=1 Tax=Cokeromyces recurvatus TaxID=90255 RepID=UPI0022204DE7|nr:P-loop containing nucleoside triphosphate hydrolase protein [Cokeromyces recurvatus]KAI7905717.1 P-loop containing nucleoside triphosphate hydrolase protein [Cokeromyces recurvatus]